MSVTVEFFGIPRKRTGVPELAVEAGTLGEALQEVGDTFPALADCCLDGNELRDGYLAAVNGRDFTRDPRTRLADGDRISILSADVGG